MTFKTLTLSTAVAALIAGTALAQSDTTATDDMTDQTETTTEDGMATDDGMATEDGMATDDGMATEDAMETDDGMSAGDAMEDTADDSMTDDGAATDGMTDDSMADDGMADDGMDTGLEDTAVGDTDMAAEPMEPLVYESLETMTIDQFLGLVVYAPDEERIGEIDYLVMGNDGPEGVIGIGGFLGLGEYTVAIPLRDFELGPDGDRLILGTDKEALKQVPEFDETGVEGLSGDTMLSDLMTES